MARSNPEALSKTCGKCGVLKSVDDFYSDHRNRDGLTGSCKSCKLESQDSERHKETQNARRARVRIENPAYFTEQNLLYKYGISLREYNEMLAEQGGYCAACGSPEKLVVDHDHETGSVRGILCHSCNVALGFLGDDLGRIMDLHNYLSAVRNG